MPLRLTTLAAVVMAGTLAVACSDASSPTSPMTSSQFEPLVAFGLADTYL